MIEIVSPPDKMTERSLEKPLRKINENAGSL